MFELRDYQIESVDMIKNMNPCEHKLVVLPTGSGKTIVFATVANNASGKVLIVVPSSELRTQAIEMKNKGFVMEEVKTPFGSFGLKINSEEPISITWNEVKAKLHSGNEKGMVKSIIYDIITDKIKLA